LAPCQMGVHVLCFLACSFLHCLTAHGAGGGAPTWHFLSTSPQRLRHAPCFSATSFQQQCEPFDEPDKHLRTFRVASDRGCDSGHGSALMLLQGFCCFLQSWGVNSGPLGLPFELRPSLVDFTLFLRWNLANFLPGLA
jgi:hypothetical protein